MNSELINNKGKDSHIAEICKSFLRQVKKPSFKGAEHLNETSHFIYESIDYHIKVYKSEYTFEKYRILVTKNDKVVENGVGELKKLLKKAGK